jgi:peptidoglycan/xylan/chitin deacetylase (PgdA/CDA1 family)
VRAATAARGAAALTAGAAFVHFVPGVVFWRSARWRFLPRLSGVGRPEHVALTFDDGPDPASTPLFLDTLDLLGWKATFFCLGEQARRSPSLVCELVARGHEVGVHGDSHKSHLLRSAPAVVRDVARARACLEDITGRPVEWFRPPYGGVSLSTLAAARKNGLRLVLWTTWGRDWEDGATAETVAATLRKTFVPGATVLLHDSDVTSAKRSWQATLGSLPLAAGEWRSRRLTVGTLGEHFA